MTATIDDVHRSRTFPGAAVDGNALRRILRNKAQAARQPNHCYIVPRTSRDIGPNGFVIVRAQHTSSYRGQSDEGPQTIDHLDTIMSGPDSLYKVHAYQSYLTGHFSRFVRSSGARISRIKVAQRVTSGFFRFHSHHVLLRHSIDLQILRQTWRLLPH